MYLIENRHIERSPQFVVTVQRLFRVPYRRRYCIFIEAQHGNVLTTLVKHTP